jgi:hypothetical protein
MARAAQNSGFALLPVRPVLMPLARHTAAQPAGLNGCAIVFNPFSAPPRVTGAFGGFRGKKPLVSSP